MTAGRDRYAVARLGRRPLRSGLALLLLVAMRGAGLAGAGDTMPGRTPDLDAGYVAAISGTCDELVVRSRAVSSCGDTLLNVDFANGRVAFVFAGRLDDAIVLTVVSGGRSSQTDARTYDLTIDRITTATLGDGGARDTVVTPAEGTCSMRGDPTQEPARFECRVRSAGRETIARFRSGGSADDAARHAGDLDARAAAVLRAGIF